MRGRRKRRTQGYSEIARACVIVQEVVKLRLALPEMRNYLMSMFRSDWGRHPDHSTGHIPYERCS
jgi:hypothetical protein